MNWLMRRTIFLALLAALLIAPAARASDDPVIQKIQRDCNDDSVLQGTYTVARVARSAEQSADGCRRVLRLP